ncbi:PspC domain-containing protein [Spirillospora albida]|uniref:PspC domain-containing protein n=1 Tax=Spirillospora albida TaxID=58123 RepID=UPI0004C079FB|nr:PspC domain-containing protein [Spirillospora albida]
MDDDTVTTATREPGAPYRRLARDPERRLVAGVCTGLGRYTGIDPVLFRVGFAVLTLAHGQGLFLYIAAALLMPAQAGASSPVERLFRRWFDGTAVLTVLGALLCFGAAGTLFGGFSVDAIAILVVFALVLLVSHARGVDLVGAARAVPERLAGHPPGETVPDSLRKETPQTGAGLPEGMIDLAVYGRDRTAATAPPAPATPGIIAAPTPAAPAAPAARCGSPATAVTLLAAMAAGAAMIPVAQPHPAPQAMMIVLAPALAVIGCGLVLGGWLRTRGLAAAGTVLTLTLLVTSVASEAPKDAAYGEIEWRPTDANRTHQEYRVAVGQGTLDLTALPVARGRRVTITTEVALGGLVVRLPSTARVILDARVGFGDLSVNGRTRSGPNARTTEVIEPDGTPVPDPPEIVLRIRGKLSDVEVITRG